MSLSQFPFLPPPLSFFFFQKKKRNPLTPLIYIFVEHNSIELKCDDGMCSTDVFPCLNTAFASNICVKAKALIDKVTMLLKSASQLAETEDEDAMFGIQNLFGLVLKLLSRTLLLLPGLPPAFVCLFASLMQTSHSHSKYRNNSPLCDRNKEDGGVPALGTRRQAL